MENSSRPLPSGRADRRHRAGSRRHRAGIEPPAVLGLDRPDLDTGQPEQTGPDADQPDRPGPGLPGLAGLSDRLLDPVAEEDLAGADEEAEEARQRFARRRRLTLTGLALTAGLSAVLLVLTLLNWVPQEPASRPLTSAERGRLAVMRVTNQRDLRAGLQVTIGRGGDRTDLLGWVDWARRLVYVDVGGPGAGVLRGLAQATPTVLMSRPDPTAVPAPAMPPLIPPVDGWRVAPDQRLTPLLAMIFALTADRPDPVDETSGRWVGRERQHGENLDILEAPWPGPEPAEATRYFLDPDGRLLRLEATVAPVGPVTVHLNRVDRPTLRPVDALGGRPGLPRALNSAERDRWRGLPARLRAAGGATLTVTVPASADTNLRGRGWLSWTSNTAYLGVTDLDAEGTRTLVRREGGKVTRVDTAAPGDPADPPPLPPPGTGWRGGAHRAQALDPLVARALRAARGSGPSGTPRRVRGDNLTGSVVDVIEVGSGSGRTRYWVDRSGLLRRLELPTPGGAWAQLDLKPGRVPSLPKPTKAR
ncbi:hypothetical protein [Micromonospora sp. NBC_01739]|uniref:hypothetical protein n=1 Tax=Micromonospora sp. NBC_01739 TaxID=2975985 RepID=UPI002E15ED35|nr:hypothetical protein OIE53_02610 [Micromonospora sp. NBC_01739]